MLTPATVNPKPGEVFKIFLTRADDVLRGSPWVMQRARTRHALRQLTACVLLFGVLYGGAMGTFGGIVGGSITGDRIWQVFYSASKVPFLLLITFCLSLPSFFVLNTLVGVQEDFPEAVRALMATQAGLAIILAALAPFTLLWYASNSNYQAAILFNGLMFCLASLSAQCLLRRYYQPLIARNNQHRWLLRLWLLLYGFVGIQMAWVLRPFIGDPDHPATFFRADTWGNAYEILAGMIWSLVAS